MTILTIAFGEDKYIDLAQNLAASIKFFYPQLQIVAISDRTEIKNFDQTIQLQDDTTEVFWPKLCLDKYIKLENVLFLDADTLAINSNFDFSTLNNTAFTAQNFGFVHERNFINEHYFKKLKGVELPEGRFYFPKIHSSFAYFGSHQLSKLLLEKSRAIFKQTKAERYHGYTPDEFAISLACAESGVLPHIENWKPCYFSYLSKYDQIYEEDQLYNDYSFITLTRGHTTPQIRRVYAETLEQIKSRYNVKQMAGLL